MTQVICGTGHRPNKLGGFSPTVADALRRLARHWLLEQPGDTQVVTGMALGWDMALGRAASDLGMVVHAAVPFPGQESRWPAQSQREFQALLVRCSSVTEVSPGPYSPALMQVRNEWMVDRAHVVLALWDGSAGGTGNCVRYAEQVGKPIVNLWPRWSSVMRPAIDCAAAIRKVQTDTGLGILEIRKALETHGWDEATALLHLSCIGQLVARRPGSMLPCGCLV